MKKHIEFEDIKASYLNKGISALSNFFDNVEFLILDEKSDIILNIYLKYKDNLINYNDTEILINNEIKNDIAKVRNFHLNTTK